MRSVILCSAVIALAAGTTSALAQSCTVSATNLNFGSVNVVQPSPVNVNGSLTVQCTGLPLSTIGYRIGLNAGAGSTFSPRLLLQGSSSLNYNLFSNSARTTIWGNSPGGSPPDVTGSMFLLLGSGSVTYTVYGQLFSNQAAPLKGAYINTIQATLTYQYNAIP